MRQRIIKGHEYKLYPTGDVWVGESLKYKINEDIVLDYLMQNRFGKGKIDFLLKNGEEYIKKQVEKDTQLGLSIKEAREKMKFIETKKEPEDECYHLYIHIGTTRDYKYKFACRRCLKIVTKEDIC